LDDGNVYHVVVNVANTNNLLDGFTITGGNGNKRFELIKLDNFTVSSGNGGGICNLESTGLTLSNLIITENLSVSGGGVYNNYASLVLDHATISQNVADSVSTVYAYGGGIYSENGYSLILNDVIVSENKALKYGYGGGIYSKDTPLTINKATIAENLAWEGGGIRNENAPSVLTNVTITGNKAIKIGSSAGNGGGIYHISASLDFLNGTISNNTTQANGGGMYLFKTPADLKNLVVTGNTSYQSGGGIYIVTQPDPVTLTLTNATISGNNAYDVGGLYALNPSIALHNTIIWGNGISNIRSGSSNHTNYDYSLIGGSGGSSSWSSGYGTNSGNNIDGDPRFVNAIAYTQAPTAGGDYHLQFNSPAINAGFNAYNSLETDADGNPRVSGGKIDMGAFEFQITSTEITHPETTALKAVAKNGYLKITGLIPGEWLRVYDLPGRVIYQEKVANAEQTVHLPAAGIYIIRNGSQCLKSTVY
jgi:hypothetical protein